MFCIAVGEKRGEDYGCWIDYSPSEAWASDKYLANGNKAMASTFGTGEDAGVISNAAMSARPGLICTVVPYC